jgi:hypothetical protein
MKESQAGAEHRAILRAAARREPGKAHRLMRPHIKNGKGRTHSTYGTTSIEISKTDSETAFSETWLVLPLVI